MTGILAGFILLAFAGAITGFLYLIFLAKEFEH